MKVNVTIDGQQPGLLLCNPRACNPLDPMTKVLKQAQEDKKKSGSDENQIALLEAQWRCHLYWEQGKGCFIPRPMIQASLIQAATKETQPGKRSSYKEIVAGLIMPLSNATLCLPEGIKHKTADDITALISNPDYFFVIPANINNSLVTIARPRFTTWAAVLQFNNSDPVIVGNTLFKKILDQMGRSGFGDWRPSSKTPGEWGTFAVREIAVSEDGKKWEKI